MTFSAELKESLSKTANLANKEIVKYELIGYLISNNTVYKNKKIYYTTVNEYNINRFNKLISNLNILNYDITIKGKNYTITLPQIENIDDIAYTNNDIELKDITIENEELLKSIVRGAFLGSGSINNPENKYHMEMIFSTQNNADYIYHILKKNEIKVKRMQRKYGYSVYIKDGEGISRFLAFIGANTAVIKFEEIRVLRDMKNSINRQVNCETANLIRTINAAVKQIEKINKLKESGQFEKLPKDLKELAQTRLENPDASLVELGQMLSNPLGKSGVNHRLKKIENWDN